MTLIPTPLQDTYWVIPVRFLAGPQPLKMPGVKPEESIHTLVGSGINAFVDLTDSYEMMGSSYLPIIKKMTDHMDVRYFNHPIPDFGIPTEDGMRETLDLIQSLLDQGSNLYLHCYGGIGRTGTVVGCYLVEQGMSGSQALKQIKNLREFPGRIRHQSPETNNQIDFVMNWQSHGSKLP